MEPLGVALESLKDELSREYETKLLLSHIPHSAVVVFKNNNVIIAGGAITSIFSGAPINDLDLYFKTQQEYNMVETSLRHNYGYSSIGRSTSALTLKKGDSIIQLIHHPAYLGLSSPEQIIENFDFTICKGAYCCASERFVLDVDFLKHIAQRKLIYNTKALTPINSLFRVQKYASRGYHITQSEQFKIALSIANLRMDNYGDLFKQLVGVSQETQKGFITHLQNKGVLESHPIDMNVVAEALHHLSMPVNKCTDSYFDVAKATYLTSSTTYMPPATLTLSPYTLAAKPASTGSTLSF